MTEPWAVPPLPSRGDDDADDTYKMVGRCLTEWEETEYLLSELYAQMLRNPAHIPTLREYGKPTTFSERANGLRKIADAFFVKRPDQQVEGEFDSLVAKIARFADRRNEIAHGVVRPLQWIMPKLLEYEAIRDETLQYALIPPLYTHKKLDDMHRPKYAYTANELTHFYTSFHQLGREVRRLQIAIDGMLHPSPPKHRAPSRARYKALRHTPPLKRERQPSPSDQ